MEDANVVFPAPSFTGALYLCTGGKSICHPGHSFGPDVRLNYLIHIILSGQGIFKTDDMEYRLHSGQGFLIEPGLSTYYCADTANPWSYIWIGFNGDLAQEIVKQIGISRKNPIFSFSSSDGLVSIIEELLQIPASDAPSLFQYSLLLSFLSILAKEIYQKSQGHFENEETEKKSNYYITKALAFIRANYSNAIKVSDVANYLGISRFYLCALFKETMDHSPQEYISNFCLGRARELLTTTEYSISEIAYLCGYRDSDVFSKAFKRKYLSSPSQYRKYTIEHPEMNPIDYIRSLKKSAPPSLPEKR